MSFQTRDLWLAAAITSYEIPLIAYHVSNDNGKVYFEFDDYERCKKVELDYLNGKLVANVCLLKDAKSKLKGLIYQYERTDNEKDISVS